MLLYERNQIKLTDTINNYFPNFPYDNVTIKNLLNHTAGLPKYFWITEHKWDGDEAPTNSEMMTLIEESDVLRFFKPGQKFDYSNTGYAVLASIVEKVSGTSFSDFVQAILRLTAKQGCNLLLIASTHMTILINCMHNLWACVAQPIVGVWYILLPCPGLLLHCFSFI